MRLRGGRGEAILRYPHLNLHLGHVDALFRHGHVVKLALFLREQLVPAVRGGFEEFGDPEGQGAHEVVPRGPIPVPHLDQQAAVLVFGLQLAESGGGGEKRGWREGGWRGGAHLQCQDFVPDGVEAGADRFCFSFEIVGVRDELDFYVGIARAVRVHRD